MKRGTTRGSDDKETVFNSVPGAKHEMFHRKPVLSTTAQADFYSTIKWSNYPVGSQVYWGPGKVLTSSCLSSNRRPDDNFWKLALFFNHVGPGNKLRPWTRRRDGRDDLLNQGGNPANSQTLFSKSSWNKEINVMNLGRLIGATRYKVKNILMFTRIEHS